MDKQKHKSEVDLRPRIVRRKKKQPLGSVGLNDSTMVDQDLLHELTLLENEDSDIYSEKEEIIPTRGKKYESIDETNQASIEVGLLSQKNVPIRIKNNGIGNATTHKFQERARVYSEINGGEPTIDPKDHIKLPFDDKRISKLKLPNPFK